MGGFVGEIEDSRSRQPASGMTLSLLRGGLRLAVVAKRAPTSGWRSSSMRKRSWPTGRRRWRCCARWSRPAAGAGAKASWLELS